MALRGIPTTNSASSHFKTANQQQGSASQGVDGSTVPGYTGAIGGDSSPIPWGAEPQTATAVLDRAVGTPQKPTDKDDLLDYLDCLAKVAKSEAKSDSNAFSVKCGQWAKVGQCENGHRFAAKIFCRKPYCDICRDIVHQQTIHRLLPKAQQVLYGAWWVIPPPPEIQVFFHNRRGRRFFINRVIKALKSLGYRKGILIVHLFGDDLTKFFFHVNVLVDGGWLDPELLDELKRKLRRLIYSKSVVKRWGDGLDIFYEYKKDRGMAYQALDYFSRPTFTQFDGNEWLADSIKREHQIRTWGRWDEEPKWHLDETDKKVQSLVSLEKGKCPICGSPITWDKGVTPLALALGQGGVEITTGYLILPPIRPPPAGRRQPTNLIELPDGDYRKHPNRVRREIDRHRELISRLHDYESYS